MTDGGSTLARAVRAAPATAKDIARPFARRIGRAAPVESWWQTAPPPWRRLATDSPTTGAVCAICRWRGSAFGGVAHVESADCPQCTSIARDRFLFWCFMSNISWCRGARVLETSPRLGGDYRAWMRRWFEYRASDFDLSAHRADVQIDLQDIALDDASLDVVLTAHVLEHVPSTERALAELFRVITPGGRMFLQIPLVYGQTSVPSTPEFHADNTPVFFNFGWDLTDMLRAAGFETTVLVPGSYYHLLRGGRASHDPSIDGFHLDQLVEHVRVADLVPVTDRRLERLLGIEPAHQHATWFCRRR